MALHNGLEAELAEEAGLHYVTDAEPGIGRRRAGRGFTYLTPDGKRLTDASHRDWIRSLAIPPAWTDVWICPDPRGHLQATGRDARGRKQYRYHPEWRRLRDAQKYERLIAFGTSLPRIRRRVARDLRRRGLPREKVLATVVRLLEDTRARIGNAEYVRENESYGLTTLRDHHARFGSRAVRFRFRTKGGSTQEVTVDDPRLARIVRRCQELPGQDLFQYVDDAGEVRQIGSADVNDYLRSVSGQGFTAKDFRTWAGTVAAAAALGGIGPAASPTAARRNLVAAVKQVAAHLGNTPAVSRASYVHPLVIEAYLDGEGSPQLNGSGPDGPTPARWDLSAEERAVLRMLERRAKTGTQALRRSTRRSAR